MVVDGGGNVLFVGEYFGPICQTYIVLGSIPSIYTGP